MSYRPKTRLEKILNGQILKARSGLEEAVQAALGRMKPLACNGTKSVDSETHLKSITTDVTALELYEAVTGGRSVMICSTEHDDNADISIAETYSVNAKKIVFPDEEPGAFITMYFFNFTDVDEDDGAKLFCAEDLGAEDAVVFTQVAGE